MSGSDPTRRSQATLLMLDRSRFACLRVAALLADEPRIAFHFATQPGEALGLAARLAPTAILYSVDEDDPPELLEQLRASSRGAPIVLLGDGADSDAAALDVFSDKAPLLRHLAALEAPQTTLAAGAVAHARVLLIDDSLVVCRAFEQQLLAQPGIVLQSCLDPTQALDAAERFAPTVILLDLEMPEVSGFELIERFRATPALAAVPIIVLSGIEDVSAKVRAFGLGASDYAEKKMERVELTSRIAYHSRAYDTAQRLGDSVAQLTAAKDRLERQGAFLRRTFGRYLSDEVVASILETPEGLELGGEKRVVTALMSDLRGFTSLGEQLAPQDLLALLNNYLGAMTDVLLAHSGTIDEFIGDAILAVFGAPLARPDDAPRAVACAVAMQLGMAAVNAWSRQRGYPPLSMGIGIHTGEVVVGNIGSERRAKYGIVGANVNLTARIESYTLGGQILASEQTVSACGPILRIDDELEVLPKGFTQPIKIYAVSGIGGPFQLFLPPLDAASPQPLHRPIAAQLARLQEPGAPAEPREVLLLGLGDGCAEVSGARGLERLCNARLVLREGPQPVTIYGKVDRLLSGDRVVLRFTSVPPEAQRQLDRARSER